MGTPFPNAGSPPSGEGDYFDAPEQNANTQLRTTESADAAPAPSQRRTFPPTEGSSNVRSTHSQQNRDTRRARSSSIRIRRLPSSNRISTASATIPEGQVLDVPQSADGPRRERPSDEGRKRSFSAPEKRDDTLAAVAAEGAGSRPQSTAMPAIPEGEKTNQTTAAGVAAGQTSSSPPRRRLSRTASNRPIFGRLRSVRGSVSGDDQRPSVGVEETNNQEYDDEVANILDVVDPEVSTLTTLTNVQNSLFVPDLSIGRFSLINRRPVYTLSPPREEDKYESDESEMYGEGAEEAAAGEVGGATAGDGAIRPSRKRQGSITSQLSESRYAVLPHGVDLADWSKEDRDMLNDHVRHMLHSRRSKFKRGLKGFGRYVSRPLGFLVTFYAVCITVFGLVWVLLLIGWISGGSDSRHKYIINIIDNVLVALFAVVGDGLAPFRAIDTYHMSFIAHYATLTWRKRREEELPKLENRNELPTKMQSLDADLEAGQKYNEYSVLSPLQQKRLEHHQKKFARSHTYYKPHETTTHYAFSIRMLITITVLLDLHSCLQISLGAFTWAWSYHTRPAVITTVILCCSISVNILAGILISVGDRRSRKTEVVEQMFRQGLTREAMKKVERHKREAAEKEQVQKEKTLEEERKPFEGT